MFVDVVGNGGVIVRIIDVNGVFIFYVVFGIYRINFD